MRKPAMQILYGLATYLAWFFFWYGLGQVFG